MSFTIKQNVSGTPVLIFTNCEKGRRAGHIVDQPPPKSGPVITAFNMGNGREVTLKARGRAISTAVDVAEITRNRFFKDVKVHAISIGTEEITPREGGNPRNVSTMEINLQK